MRPRRSLSAAVLWLALPFSAAACLWDSDTPAQEAMGLPEVVAAIVGRFPRNPSLYHEMRLTRVAALLAIHPEDLAAHDDAGVACDRLGKGDEAILWMRKKQEQLDKLDPGRLEVKEHRYRLHANLGTFLVHRWVRDGADRLRIDEVKAARDEIAKALAINPEAHFGREAYQLKTLDWIIDPPNVEGRWDLPNLLGWGANAYEETIDPKTADAAARGLAGLIVLGNAWESVDVFHALSIALAHDSVGFKAAPNGGRNTLAYFAWLRARELVEAGKGSILPGAPRGKALAALLRRPDFIRPDDLLVDAFRTLREKGEAWQSARTAYMLDRLHQGRHPDTDPTFWSDYREVEPPPLPSKSAPEAFREWMAQRQRLAGAVFLGVPGLILALVTIRQVRRRSRAKSSRLDAGSHP